MQSEAISDQKRLVRGEHWLRARHFLRARDDVHHAAWRLMIIAGPAPDEEITCIRELMPKAHILAVDIHEANLMAAIDAGADDTIRCDIGNLVCESSSYSKRFFPPPPLRDQKFDAICLDLTGPANDWLRRIGGVYYQESLVTRGVMMVTFSYGRDVVERIVEDWRQEIKKPRYHDCPLSHLDKIPEPIAARVWSALAGTRSKALDSCIQYRGNKMPMMSCLIVKGRSMPPAGFIAVDPDDYGLAATMADPGNVYAYPAERIEHFRTVYKRSQAAHKAVATRKQRQLTQSLPLLTYEDHGKKQ
jgi:hypothetical protein